MHPLLLIGGAAAGVWAFSKLAPRDPLDATGEDPRACVMVPRGLVQSGLALRIPRRWWSSAIVGRTAIEAAHTFAGSSPELRRRWRYRLLERGGTYCHPAHLDPNGIGFLPSPAGGDVLRGDWTNPDASRRLFVTKVTTSADLLRAMPVAAATRQQSAALRAATVAVRRRSARRLIG